MGCSPWGHKELDITEWLNTNNKNKKVSPYGDSSVLTLVKFDILSHYNHDLEGKQNTIEKSIFLFRGPIFLYTLQKPNLAAALSCVSTLFSL